MPPAYDDVAMSGAAAAPPHSRKRPHRPRGSRGGDAKKHKPYTRLTWEEKLALEDAERKAAAMAVGGKGAWVGP